MFCPQCGSSQNNELKFCRICGANLQAVMQVLTKRETDDQDYKFDWSKTWVADMFLSEREVKRREEELELQLGITPEVKRYNEIKAGVITSFVGVGVMVFLFVLMQGIILSGEVKPGEAEILSRIWVAGIIPFLVGLALIINGLFISKKLLKINEQKLLRKTTDLTEATALSLNPQTETNELAPLSVTEHTTKHLTKQSLNNDFQ